MKKITILLTIGFIILIFLLDACKKDYNMVSITPSLEMKAQLGRKIFFEKGFSNPAGQSCSSCHSPEYGFSDPGHNIVSPGAVSGLYGNRNAPSIAYAMFSPVFHFDKDDLSFVGGLFLDGRVNSLEEQAKKPFLNPLEMNNTSVDMVISKLTNTSFFSYYTQIYGEITDNETAFNNMVESLVAFERSDELNAFTSKYDYYLNGKASLTPQELNGLKLFNDTLKGRCAKCHLSDPDPESGQVLFTDFTYNNDGVPKNLKNPYYSIPSVYNPLGANYIDRGLGTVLNNHSHDGQFRVSSLRNIAVSAPYFHNGVFNTLEEAVHFYNVRDIAGSGISPPEVPQNVDTLETGKLKLTPQEEKDIVAFLKTLTDGYKQ